MHFIRGEYLSGILKKIFFIQNMRNMTHPFFHDASILVSVGVFLTHRFETVGVFAHFLCVKNAKTPSIWSSDPGPSRSKLTMLLFYDLKISSTKHNHFLPKNVERFCSAKASNNFSTKAYFCI